MLTLNEKKKIKKEEKKVEITNKFFIQQAFFHSV